MAFELSKTLTEWLVGSVAVDRNDVPPILRELGGLGVHSLQDLTTIEEHHIATLRLKVYDRKRFERVFPKLRKSYEKYLARKEKDRIRKIKLRVELKQKRKDNPNFAKEETRKDTALKRKYRMKKKQKSSLSVRDIYITSPHWLRYVQYLTFYTPVC